MLDMNITVQDVGVFKHVPNIFIQLVPKGRFQLLFEAFKVWSHYHVLGETIPYSYPTT